MAVHVGAGSRHETLATSGASHVLRHLLTRGTQSHSSAQFNDEIASLGARLHGETGREQSHLGLTVFKGDVSRAVSLLGSAVSSARFDAGELELLKQDIAADHESSNEQF